MPKGMTYADVGVDYDAMDPFKRTAQLAAQETSGNIARLGFQAVEASRGESAFLVEAPDCYWAHVEEGLGTKNLVAYAMDQLIGLEIGRSYYDQVAQCTVAMIVNDMITLGAFPLTVAMHLAVGSSDWFNDELRSNGLILGWKRACDLANAAWSGGETPTLKDIIMPGTEVLSGSAMGIVYPKSSLITGNIQPGDVIVLLGSSGIHANGLTMARRIATNLPEGYLTKLDDGRTYGETLLDPTIIYVRFVKALLDAGVRIHYAVNITGHGWRKLMRLPQPFVYVIEHLPKQLPIFDFLQQHGPLDDREAYGNLNMGAGFALYVPEADWSKVQEVFDRRIQSHGVDSVLLAGYIEQSDTKRVVILPKHLEYSAETLAVR